jgi:hypothetical protein
MGFKKRPPKTGNDVATKADVIEQVEQAVTKLSADMAALEKRVLLQIGESANHVVDVLGKQLASQINSAFERMEDHIGVVEDKYSGTPPKVATLREEFDDHRGDFVVHNRPPRAKPSPAMR